MTVLIRTKQILIMLALLSALGLFCYSEGAYALSLSGNVSAECVAKSANKGDEVRIDINTQKMKISTFIASVEYNPDLLEYIGYEGANGKDSATLVAASDDGTQLEIAIEENESRPIIGLYAIGTKDRKYAAAKPLATLVFKAKTDGVVQYKLTESTDGSDGYTSDEIQQKSDSSYQDEMAGVNEATTIEAHAGRNNNAIAVVGIILIAVFVICIAFIATRKRKDRHK